MNEDERDNLKSVVCVHLRASCSFDEPKMSRSQAWIAGFPATTAPMLDPEIAPRIVGHPAPRLTDQQRPRRDVPGREPLLPEPVEPAGRDVGQVERGGAGTADAADAARRPARTGPRYSSMPLDVLERKAGADQREPGIADRRDRQPALALPGAAAAAGGVGDRSAGRRRSPPASSTPSTAAGDRYRIAREIVQEVGGAVERIDDPDQRRRSPRPAAAPRRRSGCPARRPAASR